MTTIRTVFLAVLLAFGLFAVTPAPAHAQSLEQAKAQGLVGERADGLLGAVKGGSPQVRQLIERVNDQRMDQYRRIAQKNGTAVQAVMAIAGKKLIQRAAPGTYINAGDGWVRK
ncbi:YdbL family protein [Novispirillum sp. DQ9]|uniref:YdbL family protein n=1 Tax=Novispirillum sp. DQ9 TaxID=3398612 RepID=UPI003C7C169D